MGEENIILAKTRPNIETLKEHTEKLIKNYLEFKNLFGNRIEEIIKIDKELFWQLLELVIRYHDAGKAYTPFQNKLRAVIGKEKLVSDIKADIPHNFLSPAFIYFKRFGINDDDIKKIVIQAVGYHHEKDKEIDANTVELAIREDLVKKIDLLEKEIGVPVRKKLTSQYLAYLSKEQRIQEDNKYYETYVLMKGLLHRIDHSASANYPVEDFTEQNLEYITTKYICEKLNSNLRDVQQFALKNKDNNVIIIASTGIGKTEAALLWVGNEKAFFTLPVRVSLNSLFSRVKEYIGYDSIGLIHSSSREYLYSEGYEESSEIYEQSMLFAKRLNFTTIDQIFKFPFKYKGYEKVLATLAYSKVIIDEIQAYSPEITAVILKGIEILSKMGSKFMIMTATLPRIYLDYLLEKNISFKQGEFLLEINRHKIKLIDKKIDEEVEFIIEKAKTKKVLIIVNTIKKAVELYEKIAERKEFENCYLLHSLFIHRDRARLERKIKDFTEKEGNGVWITTQIVEASLDVDFDLLFTEFATLDSLFQRFGRCYRKREYNLQGEPNIYIFTKESSGIGSVYDKEITEKSFELLKEFDEKIINEKTKVCLVDKLYSKEYLKDTEFYYKFKNALHILNVITPYELNNSEAQKILRKIDSLRVIPEEIFEKEIKLIDEYETAKGEEKLNLLYKINQLTVNVPYYKCKDSISQLDNIKNTYIIHVKYDDKKGLMLKEVLNYIM